MARENRDVVGFRRIFVLFCTLVLLPAMLMSGFAIVAMRNEANAERLRQRERADRLLFRAETALLGILEMTDRAARTELSAAPFEQALRALRASGFPVGPAVLLEPSGEVQEAELPFAVALAGPFEQHGGRELLARVTELGAPLSPGESAHLESPLPFAGVVSVQHLGEGRVFAYFLHDEALGERLTRVVPDDGNLRATLAVVEPSTHEPEVGAVDRLMAELVRSAAAAQDGWLGEGSGEAPVRRLAAPFDRYSLQVTGAPDGAAARIMAVYIALLFIFYATLITGVVIISRLVWQEARLSALKTDFVSHVSHELRTPLTSIRMFIETLKMGRASRDEQEECIQLLARETERLSEMIERVLGYARLKSGRRQFSLTPVVVQRAIKDALDAFKTHLLTEKHTSLELASDVEDDLPAVRADHEALVEALLNLLGNAYKYTGEDKRIRVYARSQRRRVLIGVEDNGPGLPKNEQQRVFERFYQARNLLTRTSQGSGLGLAITKGIVEGQGGRIHVESEPGKGATFLIELRLADEAEARAER